MNDLSLNSSFRDGVQFAWDATSIKMIEDCHYKYKLRMIDGWQPRRKSVHLLFGGWYATALEHYYKHRALGLDETDALVEVVHEALIATWEYDNCSRCDGSGQEIISTDGSELMFVSWECPYCLGQGRDPAGNGKPWQSDHNTKTRENLIRTIIWYVDHFSNDPVSVFMKSDGTPAVEYSFSFEATNGIVFSGHIDRLVEYSGAFYVMDQKTTAATITSYFFDSFDPDSQMSLYTLAGQIIYNKPVKGVIIDAAQIAVGFSRYLRGFSFRDPARLDEWYTTTLWRIGQARLQAQSDLYPMNPSSCHKYNGCEFRNVCNKSPHVREAFLAADFVKGPQWDPLKRR